ncbi:MAG: sugar transferase, partial [Phycisphaeraceae bacterium]
NNLLHINEHKGPAFKIKNDPRVTRLGTFLRKSSLDELPQLINVIRGEMTLVGPRPLPVYEADGCEDWQRRRVEVTPGLTCIWQVSGRSEVDFDDWVRMDLTYQKNRTFSHDMRILMQTVPAVFAQRGAH